MTDLAEQAPPFLVRHRIAGPWLRTWTGLFGDPLNTAITLACLALLVWTVPPLLRWLVLDAVWTGSDADCRGGTGACWAFIGEKFRFILFGFYPPAEQGRSLAALVVLVGLVIASAVPRFWHRRLIPAWAIGLPLALLLMGGGFGLPAVSSEQWGGLTLTLLLSLVGLGAAFPLGILLALGRRSRMAIVRGFAIAFIEVTRGVPLIAVLYVATLLFPLMLPAGGAIDKLLRAQVAIILFVAAYLAEIVRAGLQAVGRGQYEAAAAVGLSYWPMMGLIILPQALRLVIPAFVTLSIGVLQDTTLVIVIGVFDFLAAAKAAANDPVWYGWFDEAFLFAAALYFVLCFIASRYSLWLERRLKRG